MKLRFFGRLRDTLGASDVDVDVPDEIRDSDTLRTWLGTDYPALLDSSVRLALDDTIVTGRQPLGVAREAAFLPPVSGG